MLARLHLGGSVMVVVVKQGKGWAGDRGGVQFKHDILRQAMHHASP